MIIHKLNQDDIDDKIEMYFELADLNQLYERGA